MLAVLAPGGSDWQLARTLPHTVVDHPDRHQVEYEYEYEYDLLPELRVACT